MIIRLANKAYRIGEGWVNLAKYYLGVPKEAVETLAVKRLALCLPCEYNFKKICKACNGCPIIAKVRSPNEKCPKNKW